MSSKYSSALKRLQKRLAAGELRTEPEVCKAYSGDKWYAAALPDAVALPSNTKAVAEILKFASKNRIPVTPRGAGYGYVGGCVPVKVPVVARTTTPW